MTTDSLTERESQALQHLQKAQELGSTLTEYCSAFGVEVKELYAIKQQLVRRGVLPGRSKTEAGEPANPFVPVRIVPSAPASNGVACRLVHPSGWVIECGGFPPVAWIASLLAEEAHAAT